MSRKFKNIKSLQAPAACCADPLKSYKSARLTKKQG